MGTMGRESGGIGTSREDAREHSSVQFLCLHPPHRHPHTPTRCLPAFLSPAWRLNAVALVHLCQR